MGQQWRDGYRRATFISFLSKNAFIYTDLFASIVTYSALTALDGEYRDVTGFVDMLRGRGG